MKDIFNLEKKTVFGWFVSRSFAEISFKEMATKCRELNALRFHERNSVMTEHRWFR